jgi:enoyl-CoA hydratase/carnithine racemase
VDISDLVAHPEQRPEELIAERDGPIQWVIFNRPQARNAMTWGMYDRLVEVCHEVNTDRSVRAMIMTGGGGKAFVSGTDIAQFKSFSTEQHVTDYEARGNHVMATLEAVRCPVIAAIAGPCTGGGAAMASCADIRVVSPSARYGFPIARTLGNALSMQNYARITALLGVAKVKDIMMTSRLMDAKEMVACGMAAELVESEEALIPRAQALAEQVAQNAPLTLQATKESLRRVTQRLVPEGEPSDMILLAYMSRDFHEGVDAFLEKRKPVWQGE